MRLGLSVGGATGLRDVVVEVEATTTVAELAGALGVDPVVVAPGDPGTELSASGVLAGVVLPRGEGEVLPPGTVRLEVVGGPFAGETVALPSGSTITVGSGDGVLLRLLDPAVAGQHATLVVGREEDGVRGPGQGGPWPSMTVIPVSSGAPVIVDGVPLDGEREVGPEDVVQIGASLLRIGVVPASDADVTPDEVGHLAFNRGARIRPDAAVPVVKLPGERPADRDRAPLPWLSALLPVVLGVSMALVIGRYWYLMMAVASPVMVIGSYVTSRKAAKRSGRRTEDKWRQEVLDARADIARLVGRQRVQAWRACLDPVVVADIATTPTARLWERRAEDPDAVRVRVGVGERDLDVKLEGAQARADGVPIPIGVSPSPVTVDLAAGVVGVAGPRAVTTGMARAMLTQLAVSRSPRDLRIVVLCEDGAETEWGWVRWLPHVAGGGRCLALVGNTVATRAARVRELSALIEARVAARAGGSRAGFGEHTVVFIDQARGLRMLPGMVTLLERGPSVGVFVVAVDADRARLPQECATEVVVDGVDVTMGRVVAREGSCERVLFDAVTAGFAEGVARALAPVVHVAGVGDENRLPGSVRFVDLVGVDLEDPSGVVAGWSLSPRGTFAVVGAGADGAFGLDLASDGPHGLVAGTTGAGKSEFLQTFVVSLALANRPDALNFVLVDYKGGSAFADCERLVHTVGMVTNLDGRGTERALESLDAELKRRERVLRELGAKDADAAWVKDARAAAGRGLARLVLVIDEFAELKSELPGFVDGLVRIARVGRSLGVHLILATQRPSGQVTPEMQSNTNLRVALRVTDKGDSTDVLGSGEAALISAATPGRGYARRGAGAGPVGFQTARVAGRRPGVAHERVVPPRVLGRSWEQVGLPVEFAPRPRVGGPVDHDDTDLRAIVNLVNTAAEAVGARRNPSPWLAPLPTVVTVEEVLAWGADGAGGFGGAGVGDVGGAGRVGPEPVGPGVVVLGLEDVPAAQAQVPLTWDVIGASHMALIGGARSGRTSSLRVIVTQLAEAFAPADLHLYALDYGNGGLSPMVRLPHCGAVVTPLESGRLERFFTRLFTEIARRQQVLAAGGFGDVREQRAATQGEHRLPYMVLVVDGWDRLVGDLGNRGSSFRDVFIKLLREGPAVGVRVVLAGDRVLLSDRVMAFVDTRYVLPLTSRKDYQDVGLKANQLPEVIPPGRMLIGGVRVREAQMALLPGDTTGEAQHATFTQRIDAVATTTAPDLAPLPTAQRPFRVDVLPTRITMGEALDLPVAGGNPPEGVTVAVGGDALSRYTVDLADRGGFLVAGARRTGRSTVLAMIARQGVALGQAVLGVSLKPSPLTEAAAELGVHVFTEAEVDAETFGPLFVAARAASKAAGHTKVLVIVDDVEDLAGSVLERAFIDNRDDCVVVAAIQLSELSNTVKLLLTEAKQGNTGLLLSPGVTQHGNQAFNVTLPEHLVGNAAPGRGALLLDGEYIQVQTPA